VTLVRNETASCTIEAVSDGVITVDEAEAMERHGNALIEAAANLVNQARRIKRDRGAVIPMKRGA
jgi:hypothetical protein